MKSPAQRYREAILRAGGLSEQRLSRLPYTLAVVNFSIIFLTGWAAIKLVGSHRQLSLLVFLVPTVLVLCYTFTLSRILLLEASRRCEETVAYFRSVNYDMGDDRLD